MHATEFLADSSKQPTVPFLVLSGEERFLKSEVVRRLPGCDPDDPEFSLTRMSGNETELQDVMEELRTVSMFGDKRIVMIEDADSFITEHRGALEKYIGKPSRSSQLILDAKSFPKNTKLYKLVEQQGLLIECTELKPAVLAKWLIDVAKREFSKALDREAASLIIQLAGSSFGLLYQEVSKLANYVGEAPGIAVADVEKIVGGWRLETTWVMLDAVRDGRPEKAIDCLHKLLAAGDSPIKILAGTTFYFRKLGLATEAARTGTALGPALQGAGVFPGGVEASEQYLRRIGFERASRILQLLAAADHDLKGGSRIQPQLVMEQLFLRLSGAVPVYS